MVYDNTNFITSNPGYYNIKAKDCKIDDNLGITFTEYLNKMSSSYIFEGKTNLNLDKFLGDGARSSSGEKQDNGLRYSNILLEYEMPKSNLISIDTNQKYSGSYASYITLDTYQNANIEILLPGTVARTMHCTPYLSYDTAPYWTIERDKSSIIIKKWTRGQFPVGNNKYVSTIVYNYSFETYDLPYSTPLKVLLLIQAAGGGGGGYDELNNSGGGGGGGGGLVGIALNLATSDSYIIKLGAAGAGGNGYNVNGWDGGNVYVYPGGDPNFEKSSAVITVFGGRGGSSVGGNGGSGGNKCDITTEGYTKYKLYKLIDVAGGNGGYAAHSGQDAYVSNPYYGNINLPKGIGGQVSDRWAGGGGGSVYGDGNTGLKGAGGHGGWSGNGYGQNGGSSGFLLFY